MPACTEIVFGYVERGEVKDNPLPPALNKSPCLPIDGNNWNFFKLRVDDNKNVNAYLDDGKMGTFEAHFNTRGVGGVLVENGFNNIAEFRNFDIGPVISVMANNETSGKQ